MNAGSFAPAAYLSRHAHRCLIGAMRTSQNAVKAKFAE